MSLDWKNKAKKIAKEEENEEKPTVLIEDIDREQSFSEIEMEEEDDDQDDEEKPTVVIDDLNKGELFSDIDSATEDDEEDGEDEEDEQPTMVIDDLDKGQAFLDVSSDNEEEKEDEDEDDEEEEDKPTQLIDDLNSKKFTGSIEASLDSDPELSLPDSAPSVTTKTDKSGSSYLISEDKGSGDIVIEEGAESDLKNNYVISENDDTGDIVVGEVQFENERSESDEEPELKNIPTYRISEQEETGEIVVSEIDFAGMSSSNSPPSAAEFDITIEGEEIEEEGEPMTLITDVDQINDDLTPDEPELDFSSQPASLRSPARSPAIIPDKESFAVNDDFFDGPVQNDDMIRAHSTIRYLREEREKMLQEMDGLRKDEKMWLQERLGYRAELDDVKIELSILKKRHTNELEESNYKLRLLEDKKAIYEEKIKNYQREFEKLNQKVRIDLNQVKQREKELENQLELVTMDSETQIASRDKKLLELKRKIDSLEFNMENISIREQKARDDKHKLEDRLNRVVSALKSSVNVLEDDIDLDGILSDKITKV